MLTYVLIGVLIVIIVLRNRRARIWRQRYHECNNAAWQLSDDYIALEQDYTHLDSDYRNLVRNHTKLRNSNTRLQARFSLLADEYDALLYDLDKGSASVLTRAKNIFRRN